MPLDIQTLLDDYNGSAMAVAGHAEWGFIPDEWKLAIPRGSTIPNDYTIGASPFDNLFSVDEFLKANYHKVRNAAGSNEAALFVAVFRMHLAKQGIIARDIDNRAVVEDEYAYVDPINGDWKDAANDIPTINAAKDIGKFIKHHGNTFIHQMMYVFSARGHHWDAQYNDLYERLKRACFITANPGFPMPTNEMIFRLAIHAFGVKPLKDLTIDDKNNGRMAAAIFLRYDPCTPIAGTAHITTMKAAIDNMKQEAWWRDFNDRFGASIKMINDAVTDIRDKSYQYHVAAKVFGHVSRKTVPNEASDAFAKLSQFVLGYIDHLGRRHTLSGQQAVTAKSGGPRGIAEAFARACDMFGKPKTEVDSMRVFLDSV